MYTYTNYKTKKQLKEAVVAGKEVRIYQPNDMFGNPKADSNYSGQACVEGPHYPEPHRFYATVQLVNGVIVKVS